MAVNIARPRKLSSKNPKIVIFPRGERGRRSVELIINMGLQIDGIVLPKTMTERDLEFYNPLMIDKIHLPKFDNIKGDEIRAFLKRKEPDIIILAAFGRYLDSEILAIPKLATINLHAGRLPEYRGTSVVEWQIINGEEQAGCAIHVVEESIDTGPIIAQELFEISPNETGKQVKQRTLGVFLRLLEKVLTQITQGEASPLQQDESRAKYYSKYKPELGWLDFETMSAKEVHDKVRALSGRANEEAWAKLSGTTYFISRTKIPRFDARGKPGEILGTTNNEFIVRCADRTISIIQHQRILK